MTATDTRAAMARCLQPSGWRLKKVSGRWLVGDLERPGELVPGPIFKTRRAALEWATANATAVYKRLAEELGEGR